MPIKFINSNRGKTTCGSCLSPDQARVVDVVQFAVDFIACIFLRHRHHMDARNALDDNEQL